ncbi:MAG: hypothetical protein OXI83_15290 [Gemmatimonadota bacterium]|nr:hypothetical protein [Gemmatimonadota bacterium]
MYRPILLAAALLLGCSDLTEVPVEELPEPTTGTITFRVDLPLPDRMRQNYFDSAYVKLYRGPRGTFTPEFVVQLAITDTVVSVERMPFGIYWAEFYQPRIEGWGASRGGSWSRARYPCNWSHQSCRDAVALHVGRLSVTFEHEAEYMRVLEGLGYLSACYYDSGGHCHRDSWSFDTGEIGRDATFSNGETAVVMIDRFFEPDTIAVGKVSGSYVYPHLDMEWEILDDTCTANGEVRHKDLVGGVASFEKWLRVVCPKRGIDLEGRF